MCAMFDVSVTQPHAADADTGADADTDPLGIFADTRAVPCVCVCVCM